MSVIFFITRMGCTIAIILVSVSQLKAEQAKTNREAKFSSAVVISPAGNDNLSEICRPMHGLELGLAGRRSDYRCSKYEFREFQRGHRLGEKMNSLLDRRENALRAMQREEEKRNRLLKELSSDRISEYDKSRLRQRLDNRKSYLRRRTADYEALDRDVRNLERDIQNFRSRNR